MTAADDRESASQPTEAVESLSARVMAGDKVAESELFERYRRAVAALIERSIRRTEDAEDAFQQVFLLVIRKIRAGELRDPSRLSGFVCAVARNVAIDFGRKSARHAGAPISERIECARPDPLEQAVSSERAESARQTLQSLRPRDREVLQRFYLKGDDKESICRDMGVSSAGFDQMIFHARNRYRLKYVTQENRGSGGRIKKSR